MRAIPTLKISISGVRGVVGDSLTPEMVTRFAQAFGTYLGGGRVVIGRDPRTSGEMVRQAVVAGLVSSGCRVADLGVCPTPTVQLLVRQLGAQGGIAITASHNPPEWNALKFVGGDGLFLSAARGRELLDIYHQGDYRKARGGDQRMPEAIDDAVDRHVARGRRARSARFPRRRCRCASWSTPAAAPPTIAAPTARRGAGGDASPPSTRPPTAASRARRSRWPRTSTALAAAVRDAAAPTSASRRTWTATASRSWTRAGRAIGEELTLVLAAEQVLAKTPGPGGHQPLDDATRSTRWPRATDAPSSGRRSARRTWPRACGSTAP